MHSDKQILKLTAIAGLFHQHKQRQLNEQGTVRGKIIGQ